MNRRTIPPLAISLIIHVVVVFSGRAFLSSGIPSQKLSEESIQLLIELASSNEKPKTLVQSRSNSPKHPLRGRSTSNDGSGDIAEVRSKNITGLQVRFSRPIYYPEEARLFQEEGVVTVSITVSSNGSLEKVALVRSSGFSRLDQAVLKALESAVFFPAVQKGRKIRSTQAMDFQFRLKST